jgi:hypothetical protein
MQFTAMLAAAIVGVDRSAWLPAHFCRNFPSALLGIQNFAKEKHYEVD